MRVTRAQFLATAWLVLGAVFFALAVGRATMDERYTAAGFAGVGLVWVAIATLLWRRPDELRGGDDPAPRWWYVLAAVLAGLAVGFVLGVVLLG